MENMKAIDLFNSMLEQQEKKCKGCGKIENLPRFYATSKQVWLLLKLIKQDTGIDHTSYGKEFSLAQSWHNMKFQGLDNVFLSFEPVSFSKGYNIRVTL